MRRGDLFHRLFLLFLGAFAVGLLLLLPVVHRMQLRMLAAWEEDLREQAVWLAETADPEAGSEELVAGWARRHDELRLSVFAPDGSLVADSQPHREPPAPEILEPGSLRGRLDGVARLPSGGWLAITRPWTAPFPHGFTAELGGVVLLVLAGVALVLYPVVRPLSTAFGRMAGIAREVSAGHYGQTVGIERRDQLGDLIAAFDDMSRRLAEAERLQERLLRDVSHELRSPVGRIQTLAETAALEPGEIREHVRGIEQEVALLDRLVGDLVESARMEAGPEALELRELSLRGWADETARRLAPRVEARGIAWTVRLPDRGHRVRADPQRLTQAVANLVDNAVAALDGRRDGEITLRVEAGADRFTVAVEDDGPGIPPEDLPHVFRRFYRLAEHRARRAGGIGLGLSLVRSIATAHGGEATLASEPGKGTTATLRLPIRAG